MKLCKTTSAIALVALLVAAVAAQEKQSPNRANGGGAPSGAAPLMVIDSFTHDFGEVKAGTPLRYAFKVKNQGKADLLINNVSPG
ncbi:MAG TPA: DUF1573 domain-containing protein [Blastocatellia bacterium]|nr:DUF1573 domain-containing protein [Blastocatellia bacterium]